MLTSFPISKEAQIANLVVLVGANNERIEALTFFLSKSNDKQVDVPILGKVLRGAQDRTVLTNSTCFWLIGSITSCAPAHRMMACTPVFPKAISLA